MQDIYSKYNNIDLNQLDNTCIFFSKSADSIADALGIVEYIEGSALLYYNEIILIDHRAHILDFNRQEYFQDKISE